MTITREANRQNHEDLYVTHAACAHLIPCDVVVLESETITPSAYGDSTCDICWTEIGSGDLTRQLTYDRYRAELAYDTASGTAPLSFKLV